ncbi:MAG: peptide deformylase [Acidimicrobiia bacterium]
MLAFVSTPTQLTYEPGAILRAVVAVYPIRTFGDPVLRIQAVGVEEVDDTIRRLVADLIDTMYDAQGVGLAAPQIGISKRVFVFDTQDEEGARVIVNPRLIEKRGKWELDEGCLSVPNRYWPVTRASYVKVTGVDQDGNEVTYEGDELLGRVLQHELDHLEGKIVLDRLPRRLRKEAFKELREEALGLQPPA